MTRVCRGTLAKQMRTAACYDEKLQGLRSGIAGRRLHWILTPDSPQSEIAATNFDDSGGSLGEELGEELGEISCAFSCFICCTE